MWSRLHGSIPVCDRISLGFGNQKRNAGPAPGSRTITRAQDAGGRAEITWAIRVLHAIAALMGVEVPAKSSVAGRREARQAGRAVRARIEFAAAATGAWESACLTATDVVAHTAALGFRPLADPRAAQRVLAVTLRADIETPELVEAQPLLALLSGIGARHSGPIHGDGQEPSQRHTARWPFLTRHDVVQGAGQNIESILVQGSPSLIATYSRGSRLMPGFELRSHHPLANRIAHPQNCVIDLCSLRCRDAGRFRFVPREPRPPPLAPQHAIDHMPPAQQSPDVRALFRIRFPARFPQDAGIRQRSRAFELLLHAQSHDHHLRVVHTYLLLCTA